jgi:glucosamine--fructose-6-phosphate aminotransferase (isomerizing)
LSLNDVVESIKLKEIQEEVVKVKKPPGIDHFYIMEIMD